MYTFSENKYEPSIFPGWQIQTVISVMSIFQNCFFPNEKVLVSWKSFLFSLAPPPLFFFTRNLFRYNIVYLRRSSTSESGGRREKTIRIGIRNTIRIVFFIKTFDNFRWSTRLYFQYMFSTCANLPDQQADFPRAHWVTENEFSSSRQRTFSHVKWLTRIFEIGY